MTIVPTEDTVEEYAEACGTVSLLAEHLKYLVEDQNGDTKTIMGLETIEHDYWNEANDTDEFWQDDVDLDLESMSAEEIKCVLLDIMPDLQEKMSYDAERDFIDGIKI